MKSLQLVCVNYENFDDGFTVVEHCMKIFPRFKYATLITPFGIGSGTELPIEIVMPRSKTRQEFLVREFHEYITCDHALSVQWDGFIINPQAWSDDFLNYDYIAPPWPLTNIPNPEHRVGSGGFCLFSKRLIDLVPYLCVPEEVDDWQIGATRRASFEKRGMKYAPFELAAKFGKECCLADYPVEEGSTFGFHGFKYHADREKYRKLIYG